MHAIYDRSKNGSIVSDNVRLGRSVRIGPYSLIGYPVDNRASLPGPQAVSIGHGTLIESFVVIEDGATIGADVTIEHYVRVGSSTTVGDGTYLLYGTRVHRNVSIGDNCRISGNCPDGTVIGNEVTHFGRIHHQYNDPFGGWEETDEAAPVIGDRSVIAAGAIVIGAIEIGSNTYVAANEIVRKSIPPSSIFYKGEVIPSADWRGSLSKRYFKNDK